MKIPFEARWYDLEGGPGGAAVGTPWVGCVDVEGYYQRQSGPDEQDGVVGDGVTAGTRGRRHSTLGGPSIDVLPDASRLKRDRRRSPSLSRGSYTTHTSTSWTPRPARSSSITRPNPSPAPAATHRDFPGYQLAPQGLLQLVIKNEVSASKVFLLKYDLAALEMGGKMLVRERDYIAVTPASSCQEPNGDNHDHPKGRRREILKSAVELQFICVPLQVERKMTRRKRHTEPVHRGSGRYDQEPMNQLGVSIEGDGWRLDGGSALSLCDDDVDRGHHGDGPTRRTPRYKVKKAYFLSRHVRVVFPSLCGNLTSRDQADRRETAKEDVRTERFIEVINPSTVQPGMSPKEIKKMRRASFASESWEGVKALLSRKMKEDEEDERMEGDDNDIESLRRERKMGPSRLDVGEPAPAMTFQRSPTPVQSGLTSLLTARLERREASTDAQADEDEQEPDLRHWHRELGLDPALPSPVTSPVDKKRSLWPEDDSERLLSESLQRLPWRR